jgi:hypothetical protein
MKVFWPGREEPGSETYPRVYRVSRGWRIFGYSGGGFFIALALGAFASCFLDRSLNPAGTIIVAALGAAFLVAGLLIILDTRAYRVVLTKVSIERIGLFRRRTLMRDRLKGRRLRPEEYGPPTWLLVPDAGRSLKLYGSLAKDAALIEWFAALPDLDAADELARRAEIAADPSYGATPEERLERYDRSERIAAVAFLAGYAVVPWAIFYPRPYVVAVACVALFPLAVFAVMALWPRAHAPTPVNLSTACLLPGLALMVRVVIDLNYADWWQLVWLALGAAILLALCFGAVERAKMLRARAALVGIMCASLWPYTFGTIGLANQLFDRSETRIFSAYLIEKRVDRGPWWTEEDTTKVGVPKPFFDAVNLGDKVNLYLQQGALGLPWYFAASCGHGGFLPWSFVGLTQIADGEIAYQCRNHEFVVRSLTPIAESGNPRALLLVGLAHWEGIGVPRDHDEAMRLFHLAAAGGDSRAMNVIGFSYNHAVGVAQDYAEAIKWYEMASAKDEVRALNNLGLLYDSGKGVAQDKAEARRL